MSISERIKYRREELGLTQSELAKLLGLADKSSISKYESSSKNITLTTIEKIANALKTTPSYLMGWEDTSESLPEDIIPFAPKYVPLLGEVACGEPVYSEELRGSYIKVDEDINVDFCLIAKGDSMINARIYDGDVVYVKKQSYVDNGDIAVVLIGEETTLKRVYYYPDSYKLLLQPENPAYEPLIYIGNELESVRILGKAVFFQSNIR